MTPIDQAIRHLATRLEVELLLLWLTLDRDQDEKQFFTDRQHLRDLLHRFEHLASRSLSESTRLTPTESSPFLDLTPDASSEPMADSEDKDLRDAIIQELTLALYNLGAPATLQGPVDSYRDGLTDAEVLYLLQDWNDANCVLRA